MGKINLTYLLSKKEQLNQLDLKKIEQGISLYPYCQTLYLLWAKALFLNDKLSFQQHLSKIALAVGNREVLYFFIYNQTLTSNSLVAEKNTIQYAPVDYFSFVGLNDEPRQKEAVTKKENLIDSFIQNNPTFIPLPKNDNVVAEELDEQDDEAEFFSETLAKVYIKQKHYEKAIKKFEKLSLKYPKKVFTLQTRFVS
jgi:tetratricopeptide (TPR) repeat protein